MKKTGIESRSYVHVYFFYWLFTQEAAIITETIINGEL